MNNCCYCLGTKNLFILSNAGKLITGLNYTVFKILCFAQHFWQFNLFQSYKSIFFSLITKTRISCNILEIILFKRNFIDDFG